PLGVRNDGRRMSTTTTQSARSTSTSTSGSAFERGLRLGEAAYPKKGAVSVTQGGSAGVAYSRTTSTSRTMTSTRRRASSSATAGPTARYTVPVQFKLEVYSDTLLGTVSAPPQLLTVSQLADDMSTVPPRAQDSGGGGPLTLGYRIQKLPPTEADPARLAE